MRKEQGTNYDEIEPAYDFESDGPGDVYPVAEEDEFELYEPMESAWSEELDEVDVSGSQGIYSDMKPAYDFDSDGPGKAGPYQRSSYSESEIEEEEIDEIVGAIGRMAVPIAVNYTMSKLNDEEIEEEIEEEVEEEMREHFRAEKSTILEMMNRMKIL